MQFRRLWHQPPFAVDFLDGPGEDLAISFASVGHDPDRCPAPEFVATATGRGGRGRRALFVMDESRSWANHPGFGPALLGAAEKVRARRPVRRTAALGLSMGAFSALVAARLMPVDVVLAFGPQWSVVPGAIPGETRWARWTTTLPEIRWPTAPLPLAGAGRVLICHGMADDLPQALPFPRNAGADHILFPGLSHAGLVPHLKARGALAGLLDAALDGDRRRLLRIAASAGGIRRARMGGETRTGAAPQEPQG
jgi:hypothetical protein